MGSWCSKDVVVDEHAALRKAANDVLDDLALKDVVEAVVVDDDPVHLSTIRTAVVDERARRRVAWAAVQEEAARRERYSSRAGVLAIIAENMQYLQNGSRLTLRNLPPQGVVWAKQIVYSEGLRLLHSDHESVTYGF